MPIQKVTSKSYRRNLATGQVNFEADTFKVALMNDSFIFNRESHSFWEDVSAWEIPLQNGYTGAYTLPSPLVSNTSAYIADFGSINITAVDGDITFKSAVMFSIITGNPIIAALILPQNKTVLQGSSYLLSNLTMIIGD